MFQVLRNALALGAVGAALGVTMPVAEAQPTASSLPSCIRANQIQNTRMVRSRVLYIRTSARSFYRMDFANDCDSDSNGPLIVHPVDNNGEICSAIGVNISLRETGQRCMPTTLTKLSDDEVAAIPKKDLP
ncbi:MAG TPA: hypothetical protein VKQ70_04275 [Caulobacteraceae bacterium]|jgi:hypothetical protein|nr:hypothetical protein [Caulobacteraceae bacterium]